MKLRSETLNLGDKGTLHFLSPEHLQPDSIVVLFLHGFTGTGNDWIVTASSLPENFYPVLPDLPGHGKSGISPDFFDTDSQTAILDTLVSNFSNHKIVIVGYSMGGRLALQYSVRFPEKITALVIENSTCGIMDVNERDTRVKSDILVAEKIMKSSPEEFLNFWLELPIFDSLRNNPTIDISNLIISRISDYSKNGLVLSLLKFGTGMMPPCHENLANLEQLPLMLISGEFDLKYRAILKSTKSALPHAKFEIISGAGHNTHFENPQEFSKLLNRFLLNNC